MGDTYTVMYNGENLYEYKMTHEEKSVLENFRNELSDICNTLEVPREKCFDGSPYMGRLMDNWDYCMKYKEDIGYFVLLGERGVFHLQEYFPIKDRSEAKYILLEGEFLKGGRIYELENRNKLEKEWTQKYQIEYDSRKASFEYTIKLLKIVFSICPDRTINLYTKYMNSWFNDKRWCFDKNKMLFEVNPL